MKIISQLLLFAIIFLTAITGCSQSKDPLAALSLVEGKVHLRNSEETTFSPARENQQVFNKSAVKTDENASVSLLFQKDKTKIKLGESTYFEIRDFSTKELSQMTGVAVYQVSPQDTELKINTPHGLATVLGTIFRLEISASETILIVEEGKVQFKEEQSTQLVKAGEKLISGKDGKIEVIDPIELNNIFSPESAHKKYFNLR